MKKYFYEEVLETNFGDIVSSNIRLASSKEIKEAKKLYRLGKCSHKVVFDEEGFIYDLRKCAICGVGLGAI